EQQLESQKMSKIYASTEMILCSHWKRCTQPLVSPRKNSRVSSKMGLFTMMNLSRYACHLVRIPYLTNLGQSILQNARLLVEQVRTSTRTPLVSVLLHGLPG